MTSMEWIHRDQGGPMRGGHKAVVLRNIMFIFGGVRKKATRQQMYELDVYAFCTVTWRWYVVHTTPLWRPGWRLEGNREGSIPFARFGHTVVAYKEMAYLYGGRNGKTVCGNIYRFDPRYRHWTLVEVKSEFKPSAVHAHTAVVIGSKMYAFGGYVGTIGTSSRVFAFDFEEATWESIVPAAGRIPHGRHHHTAAAVGEDMIIVGGSSAYATEGRPPDPEWLEVWKFNTRTRTWTFIDVAPDAFVPRARCSHTSFVYEGSVYVYGGCAIAQQLHYLDFCKFDVESGTWSELHPNGEGPSFLSHTVCCVVGDRVLMHGGCHPTAVGPDGIPRLHPPGSPCPPYLTFYNDLRVLDMKTTLRTKAMVAVIKNGLEYSDVPWDVKLELDRMNPEKVPSKWRKMFDRLKDYCWFRSSPGLVFDPKGFDPYKPSARFPKRFWLGTRGYDPKKPPIYMPASTWRKMWWVGNKYRPDSA